jgi:hypothetical protein
MLASSMSRVAAGLLGERMPEQRAFLQDVEVERHVVGRMADNASSVTGTLVEENRLHLGFEKFVIEQ